MKKIFYDPSLGWLAFEPPEKPVAGHWNKGVPYYKACDDYEKTYAEAKANALEVGDIEVAVREIFHDEPEQILVEIKEFSKVYNEIIPGKDYDWKGSAVIKDGKYILSI